jgi:hypothetical protein
MKGLLTGAEHSRSHPGVVADAAGVACLGGSNVTDFAETMGMLPGAPPHSAPWYTQEKETLHVPAELPAIRHVSVWLARVATAESDASVFNDRADDAWLLKANAPCESCASLVESGGARYLGLGAMLSVGLQSKITTGDLYRDVYKKMVAANEKNKLIKGRHVVHMICDDLRLNDNVAMVFSINDITSIRWKGDRPEQVVVVKAHWENILDLDYNLDRDQQSMLLKMGWASM